LFKAFIESIFFLAHVQVLSMARKALPAFIQSMEVEEAEVRKRDVAWEYVNELDSESNDGDDDDDGNSDEDVTV